MTIIETKNRRVSIASCYFLPQITVEDDKVDSFAYKYHKIWHFDNKEKTNSWYLLDLNFAEQNIQNFFFK